MRICNAPKVVLEGFYIWCPQNFQIVWQSPPPLVVRILCTVCPQICFFLLTPSHLCADVIYGSPLRTWWESTELVRGAMQASELERRHARRAWAPRCIRERRMHKNIALGCVNPAHQDCVNPAHVLWSDTQAIYENLHYTLCMRQIYHTGNVTNTEQVT